jgi:hypothetical protein
MQPPEEKSHIVSEFAVGRLRHRSEDAITVGARIKQDLLYEKCGRFANDVAGTARRLNGLAYHLFVSRRDA